VAAARRHLARFSSEHLRDRYERLVATAASPRGEVDGDRLGRTALADARRLGMTGIVGAALNGAKFLLLAAAFSARQLDTLTVGLLLSISLTQIAGEAIANHAVIRRPSRRPDASDVVASVLLALFLAAALVPRLVVEVLAPGLAAPASADLGSIRLFSLASAALLALWWVAGEAQRRLDMRGLQAINLVPNLAIIVALILPTDQPLTAVPLALLVSVAATTALLARALARRPHPRAPKPPADAAPRRGLSMRWRGSLLALLLFTAASQLNLVLLRVVGSWLPPGAVSSLYLAVGIAFLPAIAVASGLVGALLPRWSGGVHAGRLDSPYAAASLAAGVTAAVTLPLLAALELMSAMGFLEHVVDPRLLSGLTTALPIMLSAAPLHAAAWVLRGRMIASGRTALITGLAVVGAGTLPLAYLLAPTLASVSAAYALSVSPWLIGIPLALRRHELKRPVPEPARRPFQPDPGEQPIHA
jgi:uncharacterized membrane protein YbaN (DUF454 family)